MLPWPPCLPKHNLSITLWWKCVATIFFFWNGLLCSSKRQDGFFWKILTFRSQKNVVFQKKIFLSQNPTRPKSIFFRRSHPAFFVSRMSYFQKNKTRLRKNLSGLPRRRQVVRRDMSWISPISPISPSNKFWNERGNRTNRRFWHPCHGLIFFSTSGSASHVLDFPYFSYLSFRFQICLKEK